MFDIEGVVDVAYVVGVLFVVDNMVAMFYLVWLIEWGVDVVVYLATKYFGGYGMVVAGVIVDSGNFDFGCDLLCFFNYNELDFFYYGLVYACDLGVGFSLGANFVFIFKVRVQLLCDFGVVMVLFNAFLIV